MMWDLKGGDFFICVFVEVECIVGCLMFVVMVGDGLDQEKYIEMMIQFGFGQCIIMFFVMKQCDVFRFVRMLVVLFCVEVMFYIVMEVVVVGKLVIVLCVGGILEVFGVDNFVFLLVGDWEVMVQVMVCFVIDFVWFEMICFDIELFEKIFFSRVMGQCMIEFYQFLLGEIDVGY